MEIVLKYNLKMKLISKALSLLIFVHIFISCDISTFRYEKRAVKILEDACVEGGLIVVIGCDNPAQIVGFGTNESYLVHALGTDRMKVAKAREYIRIKDLYGQVSVGMYDGKHLPYADNLVNVVVSEDFNKIPQLEVMRILVPGGVVYFKKNGKWQQIIKPRSPGMDNWTHFLHSADGNAVSQDTTIMPPRSLKWLGDPKWSRSHEYLPSTPAMVTANDRIIYFFDEGISGVYDNRLPDRWYLHARDAYNGLMLWKYPLEDFNPRNWEKTGNWDLPMSLPRRLVAAGDTIFATLSYRGPITVINARSGKILKVLRSSENTEEILYCGGMLVLRIRKNIPAYNEKASPWKVQYTREEKNKLNDGVLGDEVIVAVDARSGKKLWEVKEKRIVTLTLAATMDYVCYHTFEEVVCLDRKTGEQAWRKKNESWPDYTGTSGSLLMYEDIVFYASDQGIHAWQVDNGDLLWKGKRIARTGIRNPPDLFVANGLLWGGFTLDMNTGVVPQERSPFAVEPMSGFDVQGLNPNTGKVMKSIPIDNLISEGHHVRCYRGKATDRFLLWPKRGIEFVDVSTWQQHERCDWIRGECSYGIMPANGLLYIPPHSCVCYSGVLLTGFYALSGETRPRDYCNNITRLVKGEAYPASKAGKRIEENHSDWPTYRHDMERSGSTKTKVPLDLGKKWMVMLGGELTSPVVAEGMVYVASSNTHLLTAIDEESGKIKWQFTAGARIDSPPTIYNGKVLFGSCDGWVYCLQANDGRLVWKFHAAPSERLIVVRGQLESTWPVPGNVLVVDGLAYFAVGRSSFLDGGIQLYALDASTGQVRYKTRLDGPWPDVSTQKGEPYFMDGAKSDILSSDGISIFLGFNTFDLMLQKRRNSETETKLGLRSVDKHLMAGNGFLDHTWHDRVSWLYSNKWPGRFHNWEQISHSGQILVFDDNATYSLKGFPTIEFMSPLFIPGEGHSLRADSNIFIPQFNKEKVSSQYDSKWNVKSNVRAFGMVLSGNTLFIAGTEDLIPEEDPYKALDGRNGALLQAVNSEDGMILKEYRLDSPLIFDGMIAANSKLILATRDGELMCLSGKEKN